MPDGSLDKEISSIIGDQIENTDNRDNQLAFDDDLEDLDGDYDEVETKLDLARAYLDMDDGEGAKDILSEVIEEGTPGQRDKARSLLKKI